MNKNHYKNKPFELWNKKDRYEIINQYLQTFDDKTKKAYEIAKDHLGSSFDIERCVDFKNWFDKNK